MGERVNSKADQVYDELKEAILAGELEPGEADRQDRRCANGSACRGFRSRRRSAGSRSSSLVRDRAAARLVRRANLGRRRARAAVHPPRARRRNRRRGGATLAARGARGAGGESRARAQGGGSGRPGDVSMRSTSASSGADDASRPASQRRDSRRRARASGAGAAHADAAAGPHSARRSPSTRRSSPRSLRATSSRRASRWTRHLTETTGQFEAFARERPELISA